MKKLFLSLILLLIGLIVAYSQVPQGFNYQAIARDADGNPMHVVHRDVSPQNILISDQGQVKLSDFGVARAKGQLHRPTRTGELKGKLSYMAPEQLTTRDFDHRVDVFALGCVLYQATTGKRPFGGDVALETMYRLLETDCERPSSSMPAFSSSSASSVTHGSCIPSSTGRATPERSPFPTSSIRSDAGITWRRPSTGGPIAPT